MKLLSFALLLSPLFLCFFVRTIFAQETFINPTIYEITPGIPQDFVPTGEIYHSKEFDLTYEDGPVIFSSVTDGNPLANMTVDDGATIHVTKPDGTQNSTDQIFHYNCFAREFKLAQDFRHLFSKGINKVKVTLYDICGGFKYSTPLYLITESVVTPPSQTPKPFLDLPWDYGNQDFKHLIYNPYSWFDHRYPLQNFCCEPPTLDFTGKSKNVFYKSHSGYDYSSPQGVDKHTLVRASADGDAIFIPEADSGGAGNMIKIDHKNGYQTWYEHLEEATPGAELIIQEEDKSVSVKKGDILGRVGLTGNTTGYHIHLSVFKDLDGDGDFSNDYPFGLTDPLGWEGDYTDPWEEYTDEEETKYGAKSYKLFTQLSPPKIQGISPEGGAIHKDEFTLTVPPNAFSEFLNYKIDFGPFEKASETIKSIVPSIFLYASNSLEQTITNFNSPLSLIYNYSKADLSNINEDSLSFYFFNEATDKWEKITSVLDKTNKTITAPTNHFSQFAVMGELLDATPPTTTVEIIGDKGLANWYRSNVTVKLLPIDNHSGKGVSYTVYSLTGEDWDEYTNPLEFTIEGPYKISFLSHDLAGNSELIKTIEFSIDKTVPEAKIEVDKTDWDLKVTPVATDSAQITKTLGSNNKATYTINDPAGNSLVLNTYDLDTKHIDILKILSLKYNSNPSITPPENILDTNYLFYTPKNKPEIKIINQNFLLKNKAAFVIAADAIKNKTFLNIIENKKLRKEEKPDLILLKLQTNKGQLEYSY